MAVIGVGLLPKIWNVTKLFELAGVDKRSNGNEGIASCIRNSYVGQGWRLLKCDQYGVIHMSSDTQFSTERYLSLRRVSACTRHDYVNERIIYYVTRVVIVYCLKYFSWTPEKGKEKLSRIIICLVAFQYIF